VLKNKSFLMNLEEKYTNLKALLDKEKYPKPFLFKFIILTDKDKEVAVKSCFDSKSDFKLNKSKSNKYTTINILQSMPSSQSIIDKYLLVAKIENVIHL
jgi:hypothetical protein